MKQRVWTAVRHNARDKAVGVERNPAAQSWNRGADSSRKSVCYTISPKYLKFVLFLVRSQPRHT